ncbi:MAG: AraC family transcriptional regulator [Shinella sp.]|nr:AraC family transcriptional regulator [Shinella sp.]
MSIDPLMGFGNSRSRGEFAGARMPMRWHDDAIVFETADWRSQETEIEWTAEHHLVVLTNCGSTVMTQVRAAGELAFEGRDMPGALSFVPATIDRKCFYKAADLSYSALWIRPDLIDDWHLPPPPDKLTVNGQDPVIQATVGALRDEIRRDDVPDISYVEQVVRMIVHRLCRLDRQPASGGGRLSRRMLSRIDDYIRSNIGRQISLSELSAVTGLPLDSFARRFKATTGQTPYAWILELRVRHLAERLRDKNADLCMLAAELGFSSQSHMTNTFRRLRGMTPAHYRRQNLPAF